MAENANESKESGALVAHSGGGLKASPERRQAAPQTCRRWPRSNKVDKGVWKVKHTVDLDWAPPPEEWDFRSITREQCRTVCHYEYLRSALGDHPNPKEWAKQVGKGFRTLSLDYLQFGANLSVPWLGIDKFTYKRFASSDINNPASFVAQLHQGTDGCSRFLWASFTPEDRRQMLAQSGDQQSRSLIDALNQILQGKSIYTQKRFPEDALARETKRLLATHPKGEELVKLNRMLIEDVYPREIAANYLRTPLPLRLFNFWDTSSVCVRTLAEAKKAIQASIADGVPIAVALDRHLPGSQYQLAAHFYCGTKQIKKSFAVWLREEAKKYPPVRKSDAEPPYEKLRWLAAYRLDPGRVHAGMSVDDCGRALSAYSTRNPVPGCEPTLPIYRHHSGWSRVKSRAEELIALLKSDPYEFEMRIHWVDVSKRKAPGKSA